MAKLFVREIMAVARDVVRQHPDGIRHTELWRAIKDAHPETSDGTIAAEPLGGNCLQGKWGTPDVLGVYKPLAKHKVKFDIEIVSAEVKVDPGQGVTAFGQAVVYRLFSSRVYLVMPSTMSATELGRLDALASLFGIGLVIFEMNPADPRFSIRVRAQTFNPDTFLVNELADRLSATQPDLFQRLFG